MDSLSDYFDDVLFKHHPHGFCYDDCDRDDEGVTCEYCWEDGFTWGRHKGSWRLMDDKGEVHSCEEYRRRSDVGSMGKR